MAVSVLWQKLYNRIIPCTRKKANVMAEYTISSNAINEEFEKINSFLENNSIDGKRLIDLYHEIHSEGNYCFDRAVRYDMPTASNIEEFRNKLDNLSSEDILVNECSFESEELKQRFFDTKGMFVWFNHFVFDTYKSISENLKHDYSETELDKYYKLSEILTTYPSKFYSQYFRNNFAENLKYILEDTYPPIKRDMFYEFGLSEALFLQYSVPEIYVLFKIWEKEKTKNQMLKLLNSVDLFTRQYLYVMAFDNRELENYILKQCDTNMTMFRKLCFLIHKFHYALAQAWGNKYVHIDWANDTVELVDDKNGFKFAEKEKNWGRKVFFLETVFDNDVPLISFSPYMCKIILGYFPDKNPTDIITFQNAYSALSYGYNVFYILSSVLDAIDSLSTEYKTEIGFNKKIYKKLKEDQEKYKELYEDFLDRNKMSYARSYANDSILMDKYKKARINKKRDDEIQELKDWKKQKESVANYLAAISNDDTGSLLQAKDNFIKGMSHGPETITKEELEKLTEGICKKLQEAIQEEEDFDVFFENIKNSFSMYKTILQGDNTKILKSLASAEWLYSQYIANKKEQKNFDYCFIALPYYKVLEAALNEIIYKPYKKTINRDISKFKNINYKEYFSNPDFYLKNKKLKKSCELGPLAYILKDCTKKFIKFLEEKYNLSFSENDIECIKEFGTRISGELNPPGISVYRNNAAHGDKIISYSDAKNAKTHIYPSCSKKCNDCNINGFRCLLTEFLSIIKLKETPEK